MPHAIENPDSQAGASDTVEPERAGEVAHPHWFRAPSRREHLIAAGLFLGFGLFFILLFLINQGWWFRWIMLLLGVWSITCGLRHARAGGSAKPPHEREALR